MTQEKLKADQAAMPTAELIEKARAYISAVSEKGHREWRMSIPVNKNDADMVFQEVCRRLEIASKFDVAFTLVNNAQTLLSELEETHVALCLESTNYIGSVRYERNKAAIEAAKGTQQ